MATKTDLSHEYAIAEELCKEVAKMLHVPFSDVVSVKNLVETRKRELKKNTILKRLSELIDHIAKTEMEEEDAELL